MATSSSSSANSATAVITGPVLVITEQVRDDQGLVGHCGHEAEPGNCGVTGGHVQRLIHRLELPTFIQAHVHHFILYIEKRNSSPEMDSVRKGRSV